MDVSLEEIAAIKAAWASYFNDNLQSTRDNTIWFNFTRYALSNGGADLLLKYYGGEQVYFCIDDIPGVGEKLSSQAGVIADLQPLVLG